MADDLTPDQERSAGIAVMKQIKGMSVADIENSPDALEVLTRIGQMGETNRDFARSQGDNLASRSHNVNLMGGLNNTQHLGLAILQNPSLLQGNISVSDQNKVVEEIGRSHPTGVLATREQSPFADLSDKPPPVPPPLPAPQGGNRPNYGAIKAHTNYTGDFDYEGIDNDKSKNRIFADGDYELPPELRKGALKAADEIIAAAAKDGTPLNELFPGIEKIANGKIDRNVVASYMVAQTMDTAKPYNFGGQNTHVVESKFTDHFDTTRPLDEAGINVAQKVYGDNKFDPAVATHNAGADEAFKNRMKTMLPTPKC